MITYYETNPTVPYPWNFDGCDAIIAPLHITQSQGKQNPVKEEFKITYCCIYFFSTISAARIKMKNKFIEKILKVSTTSRNHRTMAELLNLANS